MFRKNKLAMKIALPNLVAAVVLLFLAALTLSPELQLFVANQVNSSYVMLVGLLVCALFCGASIWTSFRTTRRLHRVVSNADKLAEGDLSALFPAHSKDEIGQLETSLQKTVEYLRETAETADEIGKGNFTVKVTMRSAEDFMGIALQEMLGNLSRLVQTKDDRDRMQFSIMKLLNEVSDIAEGDLTAEAEVTADATGAIADAFNYMIYELRGIVGEVQQATARVGVSAEEIRATTERLAEGSETQARQIVVTSTAIEAITASIQEVSANAALSSEVAGESLINAKNGARAVENNIEAMQRIRNQVQETAKRIKRLGERSQEIGEIVLLIDDLADRTSILALNASLQAAAAGEQGRGFIVVAEEVERLAERSTEAVSQIAGLTKSIQLETKDAVASMEETIREVVEGSQLANEAGEALKEIERVSGKLAEIIETISQASNKQAQSSEEIACSMSGIAEITELVAAESKQAANSVRGLLALTEHLNGSVSTFKLPETGGKNAARDAAQTQLNGSGALTATASALYLN